MDKRQVEDWVGCLSWDGPTGACPASLGLPSDPQGHSRHKPPSPQPHPQPLEQQPQDRPRFCPLPKAWRRGSRVCSASPALGEPLALRPPQNLALGPLQ